MRPVFLPIILTLSSMALFFQNCGQSGESVIDRDPTALSSTTPPLADPGKTVRVSSFVNPQDIGAELQAAINDATIKTILFDGSASTVYVSSKIRLRSQLKFIFDPGVTLRAIAGVFPNMGDVFILGTDVDQVTIQGGAGSRIVMNKHEYVDGQWRSLLVFYSSSNIVVRDIELADSGGDGIYLGDASAGHDKPNHNILIDGVKVDNNSRNGMSVISVDGLVIRNSTFSNTKNDLAAMEGPWDGIDFEPNFSTQIFRNIEMTNNLFLHNKGKGIDFHFTRLTDPKALPVSIRLINNWVFGSPLGLRVVVVQGQSYNGLIEVTGFWTDLTKASTGMWAPLATPGTFKASDFHFKAVL